MKRTAPILATLALLLGGMGQAKAGFISGQGEPTDALSGGTVITFDSGPTGSFSNISYPGKMAINGIGGDFLIDNEYIGNYNTRGVYSLNNNRGSTGELEFGFANPVNGFAFLFGASDDNWQLTAYGSIGQVIETDTITPTASSNSGDYFGIRANSIASATLTDLGSGDWIFVDNFTFSSQPAAVAAPEPASLTLLGIGVFSMLGYAWRRNRMIA